jgi:hypothetical protein
MSFEDFERIVNKMSVGEQKKLVLAKYYEGAFDNFRGVYFGMMKRLKNNLKLTPLQIKWLYYH